jgi:DNA replication protein DnaC
VLPKCSKNILFEIHQTESMADVCCKYRRESIPITELLKPSCLIIDKVRCAFDKENTQIFFDVVDRRYNKEWLNPMIFTSNIRSRINGKKFSEDSSLLCVFLIVSERLFKFSRN